MLVRKDVILGVRHQAQTCRGDCTRLDVAERAVRIDRVSAVRRRAVALSITQRSLIVRD